MNYITYIFIGILIICTLFKIAIQIKKVGMKQFVIDTISYAEANILKGKNVEKFEYVYNKVYALIPLVLKPFFTETKVKAFIQLIFDEIKTALDTKTKIK